MPAVEAAPLVTTTLPAVWPLLIVARTPLSVTDVISVPEPRLVPRIVISVSAPTNQSQHDTLECERVTYFQPNHWKPEKYW
jgi:hypothetical protein